MKRLNPWLNHKLLNKKEVVKYDSTSSEGSLSPNSPRQGIDKLPQEEQDKIDKEKEKQINERKEEEQKRRDILKRVNKKLNL